MDGLLVVDKPSGPTSHDVVARVRRAIGERRIGHTGTLDPMATGVLPLVLGRATRLARFLSAGDKSYDAVIRVGVATDTYDAQGVPVGTAYAGPLPSRLAIEQTLDAFRGTFLQQPPRHSAKKIGGRRSYELARARAATPSALLTPLAEAAADALPACVSVTAHEIVVSSVLEDLVTLRVDCSAGFYVRSLAHDLGMRLGVGAHLAELRRTRSAGIALDSAVLLRVIEDNPEGAIAAIVPLSQMLPAMPAVVLTAEGVRRAAHGRDLGPSDLGRAQAAAHPFMRLLDPAGELIGIGEPASAPGSLHPSVMLM